MRVTLNLFTHAPAVVTSLTKVTVTLPQVSLAVTLPMATAGTALAHLTVTLAGQVMLGGVTSCTVIAWLTVPDSLPHTSTAFQVFVRV